MEEITEAISQTMDSLRFPEAHITNHHDHNLIQPRETHQIIVIDRVLYMAAKTGKASAFDEHKERLDRLLAPNNNTIFHIHINNRDDEEIKYTSFGVLGVLEFFINLSAREYTFPKLSMKPISASFVKEILDICPSLLKKQNSRGDTALHLAARNGDSLAVKELINYAKILALDIENGVQGLQTEMLRTENEKGNTALYEAVRFNRLQVAEILSEEDNEILCYGNQAGETPLHLAIKRGYGAFVLKMLGKYRELKIPDGGPNGRTLLHEAVISDDEGMTEAILGKTKDLCKQADERGWVPLHHAANLGNISIVKALLQRDPHAAYIKDKNGRLPFQVATALKYDRIIGEIISWCPNCYELVNENFNSGANGIEIIIKLCNLMLILLINSFTSCHKNRFREEKRHALNIWIKTFMEPSATTPSLTSEVDKAKEFTLVVAALIATVTFAAGFNLPGGYVSDKGPQQGSAVLQKSLAFKTFLIANTIAMVLSTCAVLIHLFLALKKDKKKDALYFNVTFILIIISMFAMLIAFMTGTYAVLGISKGLGIAICIIVSCSFMLSLNEMSEKYLAKPTEENFVLRRWKIKICQYRRMIISTVLKLR